MYALVEIKGKQYKAVEGALLRVDLIEAEAGKTVEFESVLMVNDDKTVKIGAPYVKGAKVTTVLEGSEKGDKVVIYKYRATKDYHRKSGHRQQYSLLRVKTVKA